MEFICSKEDFSKAIASIDSIVKSKLSFSPHLSNILIEASQNDITIKASNGEMSQETTLPGTIQQGGKVSVNHERLNNVMRQLPSTNLSFKVSQENILTIKRAGTGDQGNKSFAIEILGIPGDDFLEIPEFPSGGKSVMLDKLYFKKMIQKVIFATGMDGNRYAIHGVFLKIKDQGISLVATDTRKLALFETVLPDVSMEEESLILPQELLSHLQKLFLTEGPLSMVISGKRIFFKFENHQISSTLVNGEFPNYELFIPKNNEFFFTANTKELIEAVGLSSSIFNESPIPKIVFNMSSDRLNLHSQEKDYNQGSSTIPIQYQGKEIKVGFNVKMILEILKQVETEKVEVFFNGETAPFVIKENGRKESTYILMPVKLSN